MTHTDELRLMTLVARMYYERGLNQPEIATQLDLSQATISRLLKRAQQEKIVRITVSAPSGIYTDLEEALQKAFRLKAAIVVDCEQEDMDEYTLRNLGAAAAFYVESTIRRNEVVGVSSWSASMLATIEAMRPLPRPLGARVVQLHGGVGNPAAEAHANRLLNRLAALLHGEAKFLPAPGIVGSADAVPILLADQFVQETMTLFDSMTLALVGIGALEPSKFLASSGNIFSEAETHLLCSQGAVGNICLRFYDADGAPVSTPLNDRVLSMSRDQLRRVKRVVGIAGGRRKFEAIRGALRGNWINVLVTDRFMAERLVKEKDA